MRIQQRDRSRRGPTAVAVALVLAAALTGCGGGDGDDKATATPSAKKSAPGGSDKSSATPSDEPTEVLAQMKGEKGITVTLNEATRDPGGFVTVKGLLTNNGDSAFNATYWTGAETAVQRSGPSVAGAVLVDSVGKKRYYVLRDTEGKCLCTMGLTLIKPGETRPLFAQFPAPPEGTTEMEFQLPTMPPAKITIAEG
ncbi:hypothetical protein SAMN05216252_106301 [Actinacidiphila glaucinigra]|uniref:Secreted protein n=1 Tax=Actinacidiphila glaucinigra TaxID=235986 RepID=A0A239F3E7_9ACTN|nr:hypothetical protein SAMN05216252_106301 [Actinacidiphila glaucinigra]